MADYNALDDAASAALWAVRHAPREHIGVLYGNELQSSPLSPGRESTARGRFTIPTGSLRALVHNHPPSSRRGRFSDDDTSMARHRRVPSYITAGEQMFRYDPATSKTEEVLSQIPVEQIRRLYLSEALKK